MAAGAATVVLMAAARMAGATAATGATGAVMVALTAVGSLEAATEVEARAVGQAAVSGAQEEMEDN